MSEARDEAVRRGAPRDPSRRRFLTAGAALATGSVLAAAPPTGAAAATLQQPAYSGSAGPPAWTPNTPYSVNQMVINGAAGTGYGTYICTTAHTSGSTFPGAGPGSPWQVVGPSWFAFVEDFGADPTGTNDSTAAFNAAILTGRQVVLGAGTYKIGTSAELSAFGRSQGMVGLGSQMSSITYFGSGTCLQAYDPDFDDSSSFGGSFGGFSLAGQSAGPAAIGFSWGNLTAGRVHDVSISGFGGTGLLFQNMQNGSSAPAWSEQAEWTAIRLVQNTNNVVFDTSSFDYSVYEFVIEANAGQNGVTLQHGAQLQGVRMELRGNFNAGAANAAWVLGIDPEAGGGTAADSQLASAQLFVNVEADGSGTGHTTIKLAGGSNSALTGVGVLNFLPTSGSFSPASLGSGPDFGFSGVLNEPSLSQMTPGDGLVVRGGTGWTEVGNLTTEVYSPLTIYPEAGDVQAMLLDNGQSSVSFFSNGSAALTAKRLELFVRQPLTGTTPGTLAWPSTVKWAGGTGGALSSDNGAIDRITLTYLPSAGMWFGTVDLGFA